MIKTGIMAKFQKTFRSMDIVIIWGSIKRFHKFWKNQDGNLKGFKNYPK